jgi:superfamily II DNA/RNA helicase
MPPEIARLTQTFLSNPVRIEVSRPATMLAAVTQILIATDADPEKKREVLRRLIREAEGLKNGIIFCNRKTEVAKLHRSLVKHGFSALALHGDMDQRSRMNALEAFRKNEVTLLVASDVAARGLDIPEVSHIFNFDLPHHAEDYVHRIGRTGRAGRSGAAITLVAPADKKSLAAIEKLIGQQIPWAAKSERGATAGTSPEPGSSHRQKEGRGQRDGRGSRSPRRPAHSERSPRSDAPPAARPAQSGRPATPPAPPAQNGRPATPPAPSAADSGPQNDQSHLPAFLLRPLPVKAS